MHLCLMACLALNSTLCFCFPYEPPPGHDGEAVSMEGCLMAGVMTGYGGQFTRDHADYKVTGIRCYGEGSQPGLNQRLLDLDEGSPKLP
jgi:hypothetical protein